MMTQDDPYARHGTSPSSTVALESVRITLDLYRTGKSGILYSKLQQFAQPILDHYQIELGVSYDDDVTASNIEDMTLLLDILETATAFWDYCSLDPTAKQDAFHHLKDGLLGLHPTREELVQFPVLVASMEEKWEFLSEGEPLKESFTSVSNPDIIQPEPALYSENGQVQYGPENLDIPEAFALFSRPLLDNEALYEDPESLDETMTRAQAYWDLAHLSTTLLSTTDMDSHLKRLMSTYCSATTSERANQTGGPRNDSTLSRTLP